VRRALAVMPEVDPKNLADEQWPLRSLLTSPKPQQP
jgi:hypothetical protein